MGSKLVLVTLCILVMSNIVFTMPVNEEENEINIDDLSTETFSEEDIENEEVEESLEKLGNDVIKADEEIEKKLRSIEEHAVEEERAEDEGRDESDEKPEDGMIETEEDDDEEVHKDEETLEGSDKVDIDEEENKILFDNDKGKDYVAVIEIVDENETPKAKKGSGWYENFKNYLQMLKNKFKEQFHYKPIKYFNKK